MANVPVVDLTAGDVGCFQIKNDVKKQKESKFLLWKFQRGPEIFILLDFLQIAFIILLFWNCTESIRFKKS